MGVPYLDFDRREWAALRAATPLTLAEADLAELQGLNERVSLAEVETIYLPVSRLLNLHVAATQGLHKANDTFLGSTPARTPEATSTRPTGRETGWLLSPDAWPPQSCGQPSASRSGPGGRWRAGPRRASRARPGTGSRPVV